eukprot:5736184-Alexandrium_andersonii.AAC.1
MQVRGELARSEHQGAAEAMRLSASQDCAGPAATTSAPVSLPESRTGMGSPPRRQLPSHSCHSYWVAQPTVLP